MFFARLYKNSSENSKILSKNVFGAFAVKGGALIVSFLTTPVFIHYFNNNKVLGVWYTLLSVIVWFLNFDLGIGNGLRNNLVKDIAANDYYAARKTISSGVFSVGVVTLVLSLIGYLVLSLVNLNWLFGIEEGIISSHALFMSALFVFIAVMLRFFLTTITSVFYALQKSAINNFLSLCVSILQLLYISIFRFETPEEALVNVSFAYIFLSNMPVVIAGIIVFCRKMRPCIPSLRFVNKQSIKSIMGIGVLFFLCQILYMIIANTNEFFVTNLYGAEFTADYTFYHKLSTIGTMMVSLALTPVWSLVTKAQAEKNYTWLIKLFKYIKLTGLVVLAIQLAVVPIVPWILDLWLGKGTVQTSYMTALSFALFSSIFLYSGMLSTIANGLAMMKTQTIAFSIGVVLKITLLLLFYKYTRWDFVVWTNALILMPYIVSQQFVLNNYFKTKII